jgi:2-isopropylmalate synthase
MLKNPASKYRAFAPIGLKDRTWPDAQITRAPIWLSTDLRDGNQALIEPMDLQRKLRMFEMLVRIGFKEIEVGFPAASQIEWDFVRKLIDEDRIPDDVTIQVMTPAREELIGRTVDAVQGARRAIVHVYNAVAPVWRTVVFGMEVPEVMALVARHIHQVRELTDARPETEWVLQYSPETFSLAELDVSLQACETAIAAWGSGRPIILNLPTTVEAATPNIFADQIEWMARHFAGRPEVVLSVHPHNDRGTGTAAAEMALMAGAHRVEGCLFGNGERTGNLDIVNVALNMYVQGVSPELDFSDIDAIRAEVEHCNQLPVPARHPYAGDLVYTSFSGSHQDAIKKGFAARRPDDVWEIPYLPIDPKDLGRSYEGKELAAADLWRIFCGEYGLDATPPLQDRELASRTNAHGVQETELRGSIDWQGRVRPVHGLGNGPIDAFVNALGAATGHSIRVVDYHEHAIGGTGAVGGDARAAAYVELRVDDGRQVFGVGMDHDIISAAIRAVTSGVLRAARMQSAGAAQEAVA